MSDRNESRLIYLFGVAMIAMFLYGLTPGEKPWPPRAYAGETLARMGDGFEVAAPGANTDIIGAAIRWPNNDLCRLTITLDTASVVNLMVTRGGTENPLAANANSAVPAGGQHVFDFGGLKEGDELQLQIETDGTIPQWSIDRVGRR